LPILEQITITNKGNNVINLYSSYDEKELLLPSAFGHGFNFLM